MASSLYLTRILCGLMGCFPWKLSLWFIDSVSDRVHTRELRVCFHTQPSEQCRGTVSNSNKESEMWQLTSQGVRQGTFVIPKVSCSPRRRRRMAWNRVAEQSFIFQKNASNFVSSERKSWKEAIFVFLKHQIFKCCNVTNMLLSNSQYKHLSQTLNFTEDLVYFKYSLM